MGKTGRRIVIAAAVAAAAIVVVWGGLLLAVRTDAAAQAAARRASQLLHRQVSIGRMSLSPDLALTLHGLTVANPASLPGSFFSSRSLSVSVALLPLLRGNVEIASIRVDAPVLSVAKDPAGRWNFDGMIEKKPKKEPARPVTLRSIVVRDGSVSIAGTALQSFSVDIRDLVTTSIPGVVRVSFRDRHGNPADISADSRAGGLSFSVSAPRIEPSALPLPATVPIVRDRGHLSLRLNGERRNERITATARVTAEGTWLRFRDRVFPLNADLAVAAEHDVQRRRTTLSSVTLGTTYGSLKGHGFAERPGHGPFALSACGEVTSIPQALLPDGLAVRGRLRLESLELSGTGAEFARGNVRAAFGDGRVTRQGKVLADGIAATFETHPAAAGWEGTGTVRAASGVVERLEAPLSFRLTRKLKPVEAQVSGLQGVVSGVRVSASGKWRPDDAAPLTARASFAAPHATLRDLLAKKDVTLARGEGKGEVSFSLDRDKRATGAFSTTFSDIAIRKGEHSGTLKKVDARGSLSGELRDLAVSATAMGEGNFRNDPVRFEIPLSWRNRTASLGTAAFSFAGVEGGWQSATVALPPASAKGGLRFSLAGGRVRHRQGEVSGLTASGELFPGARLTLAAKVAVAAASVRGVPAGPLKGEASVRDGKGEVRLDGTVAGGALAATASLDLTQRDRTTVFRGSVTRLRADLIPEQLTGGTRLAGGTITVAAAGSSAGGGVAATVEASGEGLAATRGGKTILSGGSVEGAADLKGKNLLLRKGTVRLPSGLRLDARGELADFASPRRTGTLTVEMPQVALSSVVEGLSGLLPRKVLESDISGRTGVSASVSLAGGRTDVAGHLILEDASLALPERKLVVEGIAGRIPFSASLPQAKGEISRGGLSRQTYPLHRDRLRPAPAGTPALSIRKISTGGLALENLKGFITSSGGHTVVSLLRGDAVEGRLLAEGEILAGKAPRGRFDLLVDDLSLAKICDAVPSIKGYISGRVDGILGVSFDKARRADMLGYMELWTRSSKQEKMLVSRTFLQKLAGKNLQGIFFRNDRPYDRAELSAYLEEGFLTFRTLDISHTNLFGVRDLSVSVAPEQNRIALDHLFSAISEAAARGKKKQADQPDQPAAAPPPDMEFKWQE